MRSVRRNIGGALILSALASGPALSAQVFPQAGFETYFGANQLRIMKPWAALRFSLSSRASLLLKYYHHRLSYAYSVYQDEAVLEKTRRANFGNLTAAIFVQQGKTSGYAAVSYLKGTGDYQGMILDAGLARRVARRVEIDGGIYLFRESSVLWYPTDPPRYINLYSLKGGVKLAVVPEKLFIHPKVYVYRNSEGVNAAAYAVGLVLAPKYPFYINLDFIRYSEAAVYRFAGNYVSLGLNIYY